MAERMTKHGSIFTTHLIGTPMVVISGHQYVRRILMASYDDIIQWSPTSARLLFGNGGFYGLNGSAHTRLHNFVTTLFTANVMSSFLMPMQTMIREHIHTWTERNPCCISGSEESRIIALKAANRLILGIEFEEGEFMELRKQFAIFNDAFFAMPINFPGFAFHKVGNMSFSCVQITSQSTLLSAEQGGAWVNSLSSALFPNSIRYDSAKASTTD